MAARAARSSWWRKHANAARLVWLFAIVTLSIVFVGNFDQTENGTNIIWLANGMVLAFLLLVPRWRWPVYIAVSLLAMLLGSLLVEETIGMSILYNALNLVEVLVGAFLLKRKSTVLQIGRASCRERVFLSV